MSQGPAAVASLLRFHKELKQRTGILESGHADFFRYKRFVRALQSPEYTRKSQQQPDLYPPLSTDTEASARAIFIGLIKNQLVTPCIKLHTKDCKSHGMNPNKDYPCLLLSDKATLQPDEYYVWNFKPKRVMDYIIVVGVVVVLLALVCYPLWPQSMRRASYYLSLAALAVLALFLVLAIIRLLLYLLSLTLYKNQGGFWLFPNLFEDCGVLDSFKPLYGFGDTATYSYIKRLKRRKTKKE